MSYYYSELISSGNSKSKTGTKNSGMVAKAYSGLIGGSVSMDCSGDKDFATIRILDGSRPGSRKLPWVSVRVSCNQDWDGKVEHLEVEGYLCLKVGDATPEQVNALHAAAKMILAGEEGV